MATSETVGSIIPIADNLAQIHHRIASAAARVGRDSGDVTLVAISKTKPMSLIGAAREAGQTIFGENRFDDALTKITEAKSLGWHDIQWHFVGSIQSRKSAQAVGPFALVHSVDRIKVAERMSRDALNYVAGGNSEAGSYVLSVLLQVNVSGEESKHGFTPAELMEYLPQIVALPGLDVQGLMTMAPFTKTAEETRPVFRGLRLLRDELTEKYPAIPLPHLSMGMTNDFEVAIEEGATIVRIGSAIFGERN